MQTIQPRRGGSRLYCPVVDVQATDQAGVMTMCAWPSRAMTAKGAKAIRRHVRWHVQQFREGTAGMMKYIQTGAWGGFPGMRAEIELSRGDRRREPMCPEAEDEYLDHAW